MNKLIVTLVVIAIFAVIFIALGPFFILEEGEQAVVTRFGAIVSTHTEAGLKFKLPVVDTVVKYPRRIMAWDGDPTRVPTSENQFIYIDGTARWKIVDPLLFYEAVTTIPQAFARLDETIDSSIRTVIADNPLFEAVRNTNIINEIDRTEILAVEGMGADVEEEIAKALTATDVQSQIIFPSIKKGRVRLSDEMLMAAKPKMDRYGIELIDIVIRQIRYSEDLTSSVYNRMIVERNQKAQEFRSRGEGAKAEWAGKLDNDRRTILSEAYNRAESLKGDADAEAARIYSDAYRRDEEFAIFWRTMESYRKTLRNFSKTLTTDLDYFKYLYEMD
ncbi:MAG: protease modulator HflC [Spirochaetales bacterium]|nr:protease modulator HflC [Spirochaetales bacterium]